LLKNNYISFYQNNIYNANYLKIVSLETDRNNIKDHYDDFKTFIKYYKLEFVSLF